MNRLVDRAGLGPGTPGLLALVFLVDAAFAATFLIALQAYIPEELGGASVLVGYTLAAFGVAKLAVQLGSGFLADRTSPGAVIVAGFLCCAGASGVMVLGPNPNVFPALGALYGAGNALLWPALYSLGATASDEGGRSRLTAALAVVTGLAVGLAVVAGSLLTDLVSGRSTIVISFLAVIAGLAITPAVLRRMPKGPPGTAETAHGGDVPDPAPNPAPMLLVRRLMLGGLVVSTAAAVAGMVPVIGPFAREELAIELHVAVLYLVPAGLAGAAGLWMGMRVSERAGRPAVATLGVAIATVGAAWLAVSSTPLMAMGGAAVLLFGYAALFPASNGLVMDYSGTAFRATLIGWFMAAEGVGHALGPAVSSFVEASTDPQAAVLVSAGLFALGVVFAVSGLVLSGVRLPVPARRSERMRPVEISE